MNTGSSAAPPDLAPKRVLATARARVSRGETDHGRGENDREARCAAVIEMLDHTADVGFEISAPTLDALFEEAHRALLMVVFERPPEDGAEERTVALAAPDRETLLVRWLNELIYLTQDAGLVPASAQVEVGEGGSGHSLEARLFGAPLLLEEYGWHGEVKGATFHGLDVVPNENGGWRARVILDV
jgi:SHS2 domain-containing protein